MQHKYADASLQIDLSAIKHNYTLLKNKAETAECAAVIKADAYGLGVKEVSQALLEAGCSNFFVATLDEAIELREIIPDKNIFVLNGVKSDEESEFLKNNLIPVLSAVYQVDVWNSLAKENNKKLPAILHIDTGMNRLGLSMAEAEELSKSRPENIDIFYVMSHMANASQMVHPKNAEQLKKFQKILELFPNTPATLANSGGIFINDSYHFNMVRPGSALFGINSVVKFNMNLKPVATIASKIINVRQIDSDGYVGYSSTHPVKKGDKIAIVPIGYADGYLRSLSNRGHVYISGFKAPVVGRVSMDMITVDVSAIPDKKLEIGRKVELLGEYIKVDELAKLAGTIGYEILTSLGKRYKRVYVK